MFFVQCLVLIVTAMVFVSLSERTTRRHLNRLGLLAKGVDDVSAECVKLIEGLIAEGAVGANSIWRLLRRKHGIHIKR